MKQIMKSHNWSCESWHRMNRTLPFLCRHEFLSWVKKYKKPENRMESKLKIRWWSVVKKYSTLRFNAPLALKSTEEKVFTCFIMVMIILLNISQNKNKNSFQLLKPNWLQNSIFNLIKVRIPGVRSCKLGKWDRRSSGDQIALCAMRIRLMVLPLVCYSSKEWILAHNLQTFLKEELRSCGSSCGLITKCLVMEPISH